MKLDRLHEISKEKGYQFRYDPKTGITIFGRKNENISFRIKQIPRNIVFRNKGDVKLELIKKLPNTISFENGGNVFLGESTEIADKYNQFNNVGNLIPENIELKRPKVKYFFSEEFLFFLNDNINNKWIKKLSEINNTYIEKDDVFQGSFIDCHDDITFMPLKSVFTKYAEYKEEKKKQEEKEKAAEIARAAKAASSGKKMAARKMEVHPASEVTGKKKKANREGIDTYLANNKGLLLKEGLKNKIKMGRFIKRLFPEMTDPEVEEVVNLYKGFQNSKDCGLEIVRGEQIVHFYCRKNQTAGSSGRLANSCMNYNDEKDERFKNLQFYSSIPNCGLLILRDPANKEKIIGRALHWTSKDGKTYVDQVYTAKEADNYIYRRYIKMNGCLSAMNGDVSKLEIECSDKTAKLDHYMPYLDTMNYDRKSNKVISRR